MGSESEMERGWQAESGGDEEMTDQATPNLPSRDFGATSAFYRDLGFTEMWRDERWMILTRGAIMLEFFPHSGLSPGDNRFSCCLRLNDLDAFYGLCKELGVPEQTNGYPRLQPRRPGSLGGGMAMLIDIDGTRLRLIQN